RTGVFLADLEADLDDRKHALFEKAFGLLDPQVLHVFDERAAAVATGDPGRDKSCSVPFGALGVSLPIENSPYAAPDSFALTFFGALSSAFSGAFRHPVPQGICNFLGHTACSGVRIPVGCRFGLAL